jgi:hypothetical protein
LLADEQQIFVLAAHDKQQSGSKNNAKPQGNASVTGSSASPGAPDPDDELFKKLKAKKNKEAWTKKFGNLYRDPKTGYWWSKVRGTPHAGPHFKVFKEIAKGLEWIYDADTWGNEIIGKHKGPVGRFIPYKDIIFK